MSKKSANIAIIGADGKMGQKLAPVFQPTTNEVLEADVVIITVPIEVTEKVIKDIAPQLTEDQLVMDYTSIKEIPCKQMLKSKASVIGLHPLFGPRVKTLEGETMVVCPERPGVWMPWLTEKLASAGVQVLKSTPKEHDQMMAFAQCQCHFSSLVFADTLRRSGIDPEQLAAFSTPIFRQLFATSTRILSQDPALYADIQLNNPYFTDILDQFEKSIKEWKKWIKKGDRKAFIGAFSALKEKLT